MWLHLPAFKTRLPLAYVEYTPTGRKRLESKITSAGHQPWHFDHSKTAPVGMPLKWSTEWALII